MSESQYPSDVQFAGLIQAATAAADAQERHSSVLGKRRRSQDETLIDTQLRTTSDNPSQNTGQSSTTTPVLQSSASVLFREPSEKSKKYSRPPLGKVYTDLELAPESFLRLQNAAKAYMLDDNYPERRDVVGHKKHSSNNDVAKLRLWGCVEGFLNLDNNGEKWFGRNADIEAADAPQRTFYWPEDKHKITKLCMPLFRKMVTNERQRIYAAETRKHDSHKGSQSNDVDHAIPQTTEAASLSQLTANGSTMIDLTIGPTSDSEQTYSTHDQHQQQVSQTTGHLKLYVNIISSENGSGHRLIPQFTLSSESLTTLSGLIAEAHKRFDVAQPNNSIPHAGWLMPVIKIWLPDGLIRIKDDGQLMVALLSASMVDWMDSEVRIIIEIDPDREVIPV